MIADAFLPLRVGIRAQAQCPVVDIARTPERPRKHSGLLGRRVEAIAVGAFLSHAYNYRISVVRKQWAVALSVPLAAPRGARRFIPIAKARGLRAACFDKSSSDDERVTTPMLDGIVFGDLRLMALRTHGSRLRVEEAMPK